MAITSDAELEQARAALTGRTSAELAAESRAAAEVLSSELGFLRNGERDSDYRYRKGAGHVARADRWLDAVDRCVLPRDPQTALQLPTAFMESNERWAPAGVRSGLCMEQ